MSVEWFHAEGGRQSGPMTDDALVTLYRSGQVRLSTLVWRDGLPGWQPLHTVADELGISAATTAVPVPPPLPPARPRLDTVPGMDSATAATAHHLASAQRKPLSGCAIVALVVAGLLVLSIPLIALIAVSAIPEYKRYRTITQVQAAVLELQPLQQQLETFVEAQGRCPAETDPGFGEADTALPAGIASLDWGHFDGGNCGIEATLSADMKALENDRIWLEYDADSAQWTCTGESPDNMLPSQCRG